MRFYNSGPDADGVHHFPQDQYDTAQVCAAGHVINAQAEYEPQHNRPFCGKCGQSTIMRCPQCTERIEGFFHLKSGFGEPYEGPAAYCWHCGAPYPWTATALAQAIAYAQLYVSDDADRAALVETLPALTAETPKTPVAISTYQRVIAKVAPAAREGFKTILYGVAVEFVKHTLWP